MKKHLILGFFALLAFTGNLMAQDAVQWKAPNASTKETLLSLQSLIGLDYEQSAKAYPIFEEFYTADQKAKEAMLSSGTLTREEMQRSWEILSVKRDERLAVIFTEDQMKKWKTDPSLSGRPLNSK